MNTSNYRGSSLIKYVLCIFNNAPHANFIQLHNRHFEAEYII
jgi:hypothetical protein